MRKMDMALVVHGDGTANFMRRITPGMTYLAVYCESIEFSGEEIIFHLGDFEFYIYDFYINVHWININARLIT